MVGPGDLKLLEIHLTLFPRSIKGVSCWNTAFILKFLCLIFGDSPLYISTG